MIDPTQVQAALGLVTAATGATSGAVAVFQQVRDAVKGSGKAADPAVDRLIDDLSQKLTGANLLNLQLSEAVKGLASELNRQNAFQEEKSRYALVTTTQGHHVWANQESATKGEATIYACPVCMNKGSIEFLQGDRYGKRCFSCKNVFDFEIYHSPERESSFF